MNLNKSPRVIIYNRCAGFGHIERLCKRAAIPAAEAVVLNVKSITKTNNKPCQLETSTENEQQKAQIDELLLKNMKPLTRCPVCGSSVHSRVLSKKIWTQRYSMFT